MSQPRDRQRCEVRFSNGPVDPIKSGYIDKILLRLGYPRDADGKVRIRSTVTK